MRINDTVVDAVLEHSRLERKGLRAERRAISRDGQVWLPDFPHDLGDAIMVACHRSIASGEIVELELPIFGWCPVRLDSKIDRLPAGLMASRMVWFSAKRQGAKAPPAAADSGQLSMF